jgi:hypothetical protein
MSRIQLTGALMAAVLVAAISGIGASAASAEFVLSTTKCTGGTFINECYENTTSKEKLELTGTQAVAVTSTTVGDFEVPELGIVILCTIGGVTGSDTITQSSPLTSSGKITGKLNFKCTLEAPAKCTIPPEKETLPLIGTLTAQNELTITPEGGANKALLELTFSDNGTEKCPATVFGNHIVTGTAVVKVLNPETPAAFKEGESWVEKSTLLFSEEPADLAGNLELTYTGLTDNVYISKEA